MIEKEIIRWEENLLFACGDKRVKMCCRVIKDMEDMLAEEILLGDEE